MHKLVAEVTAWSLRHARAGVGPTVGFTGEPFSKRTFRYELSGKPLAGGHRHGQKTMIQSLNLKWYTDVLSVYVQIFVGSSISFR